MADRARGARNSTSSQNGGGNGHGNGTVQALALRRSRMGPAVKPGRKAGAKRTIVAGSDAEQSFTKGFWASWTLPALEAAALSLLLLAGISWLRPREPAAALDTPRPDWEIVFASGTERLAPPSAARAEEPSVATGESGAQDPSAPRPREGKDAGSPGAAAFAALAPQGVPGAGAPALRTSSASLASQAASPGPFSSERRSAAETGKKRRTSVKVERRAEKVETITRAPIVQKPRPRYLPDPAYPAAARSKEKEGRVKVRVQVMPTGSAGKVEIIEADPPGLFEEAVKAAVPLWQFAPARDEAGNGMESSYETTIVFRLEYASS